MRFRGLGLGFRGIYPVKGVGRCLRPVMAGEGYPHSPHRCDQCGIQIRNEQAASARAAALQAGVHSSFPPAHCIVCLPMLEPMPRSPDAKSSTSEACPSQE